MWIINNQLIFLDTKENGQIDRGRGCSYGVMVYREEVEDNTIGGERK